MPEGTKEVVPSFVRDPDKRRRTKRSLQARIERVRTRARNTVDQPTLGVILGILDLLESEL